MKAETEEHGGTRRTKFTYGRRMDSGNKSEIVVGLEWWRLRWHPPRNVSQNFLFKATHLLSRTSRPRAPSKPNKRTISRQNENDGTRTRNLPLRKRMPYHWATLSSNLELVNKIYIFCLRCINHSFTPLLQLWLTVVPWFYDCSLLGTWDTRSNSR